MPARRYLRFCNDINGIRRPGVTVHGLVGDWSIFRPKDAFGR